MKVSKGRKVQPCVYASNDGISPYQLPSYVRIGSSCEGHICASASFSLVKSASRERSGTDIGQGLDTGRLRLETHQV